MPIANASVTEHRTFGPEDVRLMADSPDDFDIVDRSAPSEGPDHSGFPEPEFSWPDEFEVGTEFDTGQKPRSVFERIRDYFSQRRGPDRLSESGVELIDPDDQIDTSAPFQATGRDRAKSFRPNSPDRPRIIETKVISTKFPSDGSTSSRASRNPGDGFRPTSQVPDSPRNAKGTPERPIWDPPDDFDTNFEDDHFDAGGVAIADKVMDSRNLRWRDILLLPFAPVRWVSAKFRSGEHAEDIIDEFAVASKHKLSRDRNLNSFTAEGDSTPGTSPSALSINDTDDLKIGTGTIALQISDNVSAEDAPMIDGRSDRPDDYSVISASQLGDTSFRTRAVRSDELPPRASSAEITQGESIPTASPADPHHEEEISQASYISGRLQQLLDHSDIAGIGLGNDEQIEVGVPLDTESDSSVVRTKSLGNLFLRIIVWCLTIPRRCLNSEGDLVEQRRLKIEPLLAALPAMVFFISAVLLILRVSEIDKLESFEYYLKSSQQFDKAGSATAALISAKRSCFENATPDNRYQVARLYTKSRNQVDLAHGFRLLRLLASPAGGNQPDAHLFIANEILREYLRNPNANRNLYYRYLSELRTGFVSSPTRYDILEQLAEGLASTGEVRSLTGLLVPHLEFWPHGHFFLAQSAFGRGDDVLRKSHALAMVRHFRSTPTELETDRKFRIRYALSLALAGEFPDAESFVRQMADSSQDAEIHKSLGEKIDLIRIVTRIHEFPANTDQDIEVLGSLLEGEDLSQDFEAAIKRQLLRKGALRPALLKLCRNLYATRKASFDADDYVFWASILRQNQQNDEAREFLENAVKISPENDIASNNLANLLYKLEPVDLNRALLLSESVLKRNPKEPTFLETRGQILTRLGKYPEAIEDLTKSLEAYPNVPEIHEALSRCYRNVGLSELADAHQKRYDELKIATDSPVSKAPGTNES